MTIFALSLIYINATSYKNKLNGYHVKIEKILQQRDALRTLNTLLLKSVLLLDTVLYEDKQELIPKLLATNEDTLGVFERFKTVAELNDSKFDYYFAIENETIILQVRKDFYQSIALYKSGAVEEAKQYKRGSLEPRIEHIETFIEDSEDLQKIQLTDLHELIQEFTNMANPYKNVTILYLLIIIIVAIFILLIGERISVTEMSLKLSEEKYAKAYKAVPDSLSITTLSDGVFIEVNAGTLRIFGYEREELIGHSVFELDLWVNLEQRKDLIKKVRKEGAVRKYEVMFKVKNGDIRDLLFSAEIIEINKISCMLINAQDITERKQAEKMLIESEERFRIVSELSYDVLWEWDIVRGDYIWFGDSDNKLGYENNEITRSIEAWEKIIHPDDHDRVLNNLNKHLEENVVWHEKYRVIRKDRKIRYWDDRGETRRDKNGTPLIMTGAIIDITEQKQLETQLLQSQKMQAIGQLTGGIAHDFNNILASILSYAYLVRKAIAKLRNNKLESHLDNIIQGGNRASKLINEMLVFSRATDVTAQVISVNDTVQDTLSFLKGSLPSTIEIKMNMDKDMPPVLIDPIQFEQMVMNLCINARDAMHEVGELSIEVQTLSIAEGQIGFPNALPGNKSERMDVCFCEDVHTPLHSGDYVAVSVRDTGCGIAQEQLEHIFEPFYTTKEVGKGAGMGLATTHGIMQGAKGHIIVETEEAKGSVFRLLFKVCELTGTRNVSITVEDDTPVHHGSDCILLVDDDAAILDSMGEILLDCGYEVKTSVNGEQALRLFQATPDKFDLVITDQTMPRMTGVELSKQLLKLRPDIPIILCSGYSKMVNETKAKEIGIHTYLKKPIDPKHLWRAISESLSEVA